MIEKQTIVDVLNYLKYPELPAPLKKNDVWVTAIAKVKKANNHETMCIVENDGEGNPIIKKDFGSLSVIISVIEIYPLTLLDANMMPDFRKKKDLGEFLKRNRIHAEYVDRLVESKDDEDKAMLKKLVIKTCIKNQLDREKHERKINDKASKKEEVVETKPETETENINEKTETENGKDSELKTSDDGQSEEKVGEGEEAVGAEQ